MDRHAKASAKEGISHTVDEEVSSSSSSYDHPKQVHSYLEVGKCLQNLRKQVYTLCKDELGKTNSEKAESVSHISEKEDSDISAQKKAQRTPEPSSDAEKKRLDELEEVYGTIHRDVQDLKRRDREVDAKEQQGKHVATPAISQNYAELRQGTESLNPTALNMTTPNEYAPTPQDQTQPQRYEERSRAFIRGAEHPSTAPDFRDIRRSQTEPARARFDMSSPKLLMKDFGVHSTNYKRFVLFPSFDIMRNVLAILVLEEKCKACLWKKWLATGRGWRRRCSFNWKNKKLILKRKLRSLASRNRLKSRR